MTNDNKKIIIKAWSLKHRSRDTSTATTVALTVYNCKTSRQLSKLNFAPTGVHREITFSIHYATSPCLKCKKHK